MLLIDSTHEAESSAAAGTKLTVPRSNWESRDCRSTPNEDIDRFHDLLNTSIHLGNTNDNVQALHAPLPSPRYFVDYFLWHRLKGPDQMKTADFTVFFKLFLSVLPLCTVIYIH